MTTRIIGAPDVSQRLALLAQTPGKRVDPPSEFSTAEMRPTYDVTVPVVRDLVITQNHGAPGTIFTASVSYNDLRSLWSMQGDGSLAVSPVPPARAPLYMELDRLFFTKTANPSGNTVFRCEVYVSYKTGGVSAYTIAALNRSVTGLTGAVTDFWEVQPDGGSRARIPVGEGGTGWLRYDSGVTYLHTDSLLIDTLFFRVQANATVTVPVTGIVLRVGF